MKTLGGAMGHNSPKKKKKKKRRERDGEISLIGS